MKTKVASSWLHSLLPAAAVLLMFAPQLPAGELDDEIHAESGWQFAGDGHWREGDRIEGTWNVKVTITICDNAGNPTDTPVPNAPLIDAMGMFAANGAFHDVNETRPAGRSSGFGYWKRTGHRTYQFAFKFFRWDTFANDLLGPQIVRHTVTLSKDGRSYTSRGTSETYDPDNNLIARGCSTSTATRFR